MTTQPLDKLHIQLIEAYMYHLHGSDCCHIYPKDVLVLRRLKLITGRSNDKSMRFEWDKLDELKKRVGCNGR